MKTTFLITILILSFLISCQETNTLPDEENIETCQLENPAESISETEINLLKHMREEEKLARDVYIKLYELYGLKVFNNISNSEQKHMNQVLCLLEHYNIDDPALETLGMFENEVLQNLYDALIVQGNISLVEALEVGATIEDVDIYDLMEFTEQTSNPAIIAIFDNLTCGSRNHMRAFVSQLNNNNSTYIPQFIDEDTYNEIIEGSHEQCLLK